jgi:hypothetical protein
MNAGLANLDSLKKHLLARTLMAETSFDLVIQDIGAGVLGMMEKFCDRKFCRVVGDQAILQADRASFSLPRYPVESITQVELKLKDSDQFQVQDLSFIESTSPPSGIVYLADAADAGPYWAQVRFTYTAGFWFETLEPDDDGYPSAAPAGANLLPPELRLAWIIQCREIWNKIDKLGAGIVDKPDQQTLTGTLDLSPLTKDMLNSYRRLQLV